MVGVTVPEERTARFVRLLASASGLSAAASPTVAVGSDLSFPNTSSGSDVWGLSVYVASLCNGAGERLLGGSEEQRLEVESLVDKETSVVPYAADKVECLNDRLASRTFVAGHTLTVADLYVFAAVEKLAVGQRMKTRVILYRASASMAAWHVAHSFPPPLPPLLPSPNFQRTWRVGTTL